MKLKYYLRGLGTGIFVTALILTIAFDVRLSKINSSNKNITESRPEKSSETGSGNKDVSESAGTDDLTENTTKDTTAEETTAKETTTETQPVIPETDITTAVVQSATVTLDIYSGMSSNKVAARLEELGVVEDGDDFNNYMYEKHIENSIRIGRFEISQNATYEEIVAAITGR